MMLQGPSGRIIPTSMQASVQMDWCSVTWCMVEAHRGSSVSPYSVWCYSSTFIQPPVYLCPWAYPCATKAGRNVPGCCRVFSLAGKEKKKKFLSAALRFFPSAFLQRWLHGIVCQRVSLLSICWWARGIVTSDPVQSEAGSARKTLFLTGQYCKSLWMTSNT